MEYIINLLNENFNINKETSKLIIITIIVIIIFRLLKGIGKFILKKSNNDRHQYFFNQKYHIFLNTIQFILIILIWSSHLQNLISIISVVSAAMTIALREIILNFFSGIYIKIRKPFKVEDRIQIENIKGDVMSINALDFEILEISTKEENGQSTGIIINYPNSVVFSKPIKNINQGFKYIWDEITIKVKMDCNLAENKKELYRIVNNNDIIKSIPIKMKKQLKDTNFTSRVYFNKFDPIIYTKIVDDHIELTIRYLMHPKKARYIESVLYNNIYNSYKDNKIDLFTTN